MTPIRILILVREERHHDLPGNTAALVRSLRETVSVEPVLTGDLSILASPDLHTYDLVINNTCAEAIGDAELSGLLRFVADGKGFAGIHTAAVTFDRPAYRRFLGGWLTEHAPYGPFAVEIRDPSHPLARGIDEFTIEDELYACETGPSVQVLATARWKEQDHPLLWTRSHGKGRVVYLALGHDGAAYAHESFRELARRAVLWAAGRAPTRWFPGTLLPWAVPPSRTYRVGIVGTGGISNLHVEAYRQAGRTEVVAGCDRSRESLERFAGAHGIDRLYGDPVEMVREAGVEVASVCTWPDSHCSLVTRLAETGAVRGILCEKPMALAMGEAARMIRACEANGVKLAINHQRRFNRHHQKVKDLLDLGAIGPIRRMWGSVTTFYKDPMVWATHVTDMMRFYGGPVEWVMGQVGDFAPERARQGGHPYSEAGVGYMRMTSGARAIFDFERDQNEIRIEGERGDILVKMDPPNEGPALLVRTDESPEWTTPPYDGYGSEKWADFRPAVEDLLEAIENETEPVNSGTEGAAALEIVLAIFESARIKNRVPFPMAMLESPMEALAAERRG